MKLEETRERVKYLCLMDDPLMGVFFRDKACVEIVINVILDRDDLRVQSVRTQETLQGWERSIRLDIFAIDSQNKGYDIEIQRADKGASLRRARFYGGMIDTYSLKPGQDFSELRDNYVIFITQNDVLGDDLPLYTIDRCIRETGRFVDDGLHILYVNGANRDVSTRLGKLVHDLFSKTPEDMYNATLSEHMRYTKENEEDLKEMESAMEKLWQEGKQEGRLEIASEFLKLGRTTIDEISKMLGIPALDIQNFAKQQEKIN